MMKKGVLLFSFSVAALCAAAAGGPSDQNAIMYRQLIMKRIDADTAAIGMIVATEAPPDNLALHARGIATSAKVALKAFEPKAPGGEAKPEVWAKWDDFSARMKKFAEKSDAMAKAAESGAGVDTVVEMMIDALPCKQCHDVYRLKKAEK